MSTLGIAIAITAEAFRNTTDRGGEPYMLHCLRVMNGGKTHDEKCMRVMHDLVEDTDESSPINYTIGVLRLAGFNETVLSGVDILTHKEGVPYMDYIKLTSTRKDTSEAKMDDIKDNSDVTRLKGLRKKISNVWKSILQLIPTSRIHISSV